MTETEVTATPRFDPELYALRPWYHDFGTLGLDTTFHTVPLTWKERTERGAGLALWYLRRLSHTARTGPVAKEPVRSLREILRRVPSSHLLNQPVKEKHIMDFAQSALARLARAPLCLELFCADGYYSCRLKSVSPTADVTGVDLDPNHVRRAETAVRRLGFEDMTFVRADVLAFLERASKSYDLVLCTGGLYHLIDPIRLLERLKTVARHFVIIQSVVTMQTEDPDFFVHPAPGWHHGSRFTHAWLRGRLKDLGWHVVAESRAELPGNPRLHDRGSSFFLCRV